MFDEYSIERHIEQIVDNRSRSYFREVYTCYVSGCYRSATVMLWTVAVCDIVFKLRSLIEEYDDKVAAEILADVEGRQMKNPRGSDWELELVKQTTSRTQLLTLPEKMHLEQLQEERHLAAHPVLTNFDKLHTPTRETTLAHIRNVLDSLLIKPALVSKNIVSDFVDDISKRQEFFGNMNSFRRFLVARYFSRMNEVTMTQLFKALWKFVFRVPTMACEENLQINYLALVVLYQQNPTLFLGQVAKNPEAFSVFDPENEDSNELLIRFLAKFPQLFHSVNDAGREDIKTIARVSQSNTALAWFLTETPEKHFARLLKLAKKGGFAISTETFMHLREVFPTAEWTDMFHEIAIACYAHSPQYDDADERFTLIEDLLPNFSPSSLTLLVRTACQNSQTYRRRNAKAQHSKVIDLIPQKDWSNLAKECPEFGPWSDFIDDEIDF